MFKAIVTFVLFTLGGVSIAQVHSGNAPFTPISFETVPNGLGGIRVLGPTPAQQVGQRIFNNAIASVNGDGSVNLKNMGAELNTNPRVPVDVISKVPKASAAKAIASAAFKAVPGVMAIASIYELAVELELSMESPAGLPRTYHRNAREGSCSRSNPTAENIQSFSETCAIRGQGSPAFYYIPPATGVTGICYVMYTCGGVDNNVAGTTPFQLTSTTLPALTQQQLEDLIASRSGWPESSKLGESLKDAIKSGETVESTPTTVTGPATLPNTSSQTPNADGSTTTTNTTNNYTYNGPNVTVTTITVTTTTNVPGSVTSVQSTPTTATNPATAPNTSSQTRNADGSTTTTNTTNNYTYNGANVTVTTVTVTTTTNQAGSVTSVVSGSVTTTAPTSSIPVQSSLTISCGLPDTPACKINETGTKVGAETTYDAPKTEIDSAKTSAVAEIDKAASIVAPSWSFSFEFPTGCAPYVTGIRGFILNVCPYQSAIHSLLSAIWAASTIFAMIGMVGRTIRNQ